MMNSLAQETELVVMTHEEYIEHEYWADDGEPDVYGEVETVFKATWVWPTGEFEAVSSKPPSLPEMASTMMALRPSTDYMGPMSVSKSAVWFLPAGSQFKTDLRPSGSVLAYVVTPNGLVSVARLADGFESEQTAPQGHKYQLRNVTIERYAFHVSEWVQEAELDLDVWGEVFA